MDILFTGNNGKNISCEDAARIIELKIIDVFLIFLLLKPRHPAIKTSGIRTSTYLPIGLPVNQSNDVL